MVEITVKAKVLWITEDDLEVYDEDDHEERPKSKFVWGIFTMNVDEVRFYWGQSKNRSVIECKSGRHILVHMPHSELKELISNAKEELYKKQIALAEGEELSEEEDLILGEPEDNTED